MPSLTRVSRVTGEAEVTMVRRGPEREDDFVACPKWPADVVEGFDIDGTTYQAHIS